MLLPLVLAATLQDPTVSAGIPASWRTPPVQLRLPARIDADVRLPEPALARVPEPTRPSRKRPYPLWGSMAMHLAKDLLNAALGK